MTAEAREPILLGSDSDGAIAGFAVATGWAHETPRLRGVTDRAMQWLAATPGVRAQWQVDALVTYFWLGGSPRNVRIGLADVLRQATRPPVPAPLTQTTGLPEADAALLMRRWGLRGFGMQGWSRLGFVTADAQDVAEVLSRIGPATVQLFAINAEVDPAVVPDTEAACLPAPDFPPLVSRPTLFDGEGGFAMGWHVPAREPVAEAMVRLAVAQATAATGGGPPDPLKVPELQWMRRHLGAQGSHAAIVVPAGLSDEATAQLAERLRRWTSLGIDQDDLDRAVSATFEARPRSSWDLVQSAVEESLAGSGEVFLQELKMPTAEGVRGSLAGMLDSLVVIAPELSTAVRLAEPAVVAQPEPMRGDTYQHVPLIRRGERRHVVVTAGREGLGFRDAAGVTTIRRPDVAVVEQWPGGQLQVTAVDGQQLVLDPAELCGGHRLSEQVRDLAPDAVVEHAQTRAASPSLARAYRQAGGWALTALVMMVPAALLAALLLLGALAESEPGGDRVGYATVGLVFAALAGLAGLRVVRLRRAGRSVGLGPWGQPRSTSSG